MRLTARQRISQERPTLSAILPHHVRARQIVATTLLLAVVCAVAMIASANASAAADPRDADLEPGFPVKARLKSQTSVVGSAN
jgi:hypothetical protein